MISLQAPELAAAPGLAERRRRHFQDAARLGPETFRIASQAEVKIAVQHFEGAGERLSALFLELPARLFALRAEGHAFLSGGGQGRRLQPGRLGPLRRREPNGRLCLIGRRGLEKDDDLAVDDLAMIRTG